MKLRIRIGDELTRAERLNQQPVVGVRLRQGLGNQMHQYAAGLALSEHLGAELRCDTSHFERRDHRDRGLGLGAFGLRWAPCRVPPYKPLRQLAAKLGIIDDTLLRAPIFARDVDLDPAFWHLTAPCSIRGYLQSWRYFEGHEGSVRRAFDTEKLKTPRTLSMEARIAAARNPVAVHVRRGDYARSPEVIDRFGLLPPEYYRRGRSEIEARVAAPTYFLFSDDIEHARDALADWPNLTPVAGYDRFEDLRLISLCRHFIIANSTFSWWGAWLGKAPDKQVVAPRAWFGPGFPHPYSVEDRLPPEWIAI